MCTASAPPSDQNGETIAVSPYARKRAETMVLFHRLKALSQDDPARERLRTELIEDHMPYARHIALRYGGRGELTEDFVQVAYLALVKAVDNFDPDRGTGFLVTRPRSSSARSRSTSATPPGTCTYRAPCRS